MINPRTPCIIGVAKQTWREDAPEPLVMWEDVARAAAVDAGLPTLVHDLDALQIVYCQTWQYDDAVRRLSERFGATPDHQCYSGIGGTTPQQLVNTVGESILRGKSDLALVTGAEALATQRQYKRRGERFPYSFKPDEKRPFPWEAPFHPAEVAHEVLQAWLTFAIFDNARRAHLGVALDDYRRQLGALWEPFTRVAAANSDAWFRTERSAEEIITPTAENRMVGYPYTKYMVSIMDVDMAAALILASHERADALGIPQDQRVYLRGWCYATDPTYVAEHPDLWRSPAMAAAAREAMRGAGVGVDDIAHFDLYSCFSSSVLFACDALGIAPDDARGLTVTGGLPYHGGAGSDYLTHSIATMVDVLRSDSGSFGMVSGVGMHMTKHAYAVYSTAPGEVQPPNQEAVQSVVDATPTPSIVETWSGDVTVAAYSVVHGRDGTPEWGLVVCDVPGGARCYAKVLDRDCLQDAERVELVGKTVQLVTTEVDGPMGTVSANVATWS